MNKLYILIYTIFIVALPIQIQSFDTVLELLNYASTVDEFPDSDLDLEGILAQDNPTFHIFYPKIDPGFFGRIACKLNILRPYWCFDDFLEAIQQLYNNQQKQPWFKFDSNIIQGKGLAVPHIIGCIATDKTKLIVVGELSGAFHSLSYIVNDWRETGIIDDHFIVQDHNTHIVFLGDLVGTSAYNLETLTAVATILKRNPNNSWYLCGATEDRRRWTTTPMYHAIKTRSHLDRTQRRSIYKLVDGVFSLLPKAFLLMSPSQQEAIVCASHRVFETIDSNDLQYCIQQLNSENVRGCLLYGKQQQQEHNVSLLALLEDRRVWNTAVIPPPFEKINILSIKGSVWDLVSGTTRALRSNYLFRWYGYFIIQPHGNELENSILEYRGKTIGENVFKLQDMYNIVTGEPVNMEKSSFGNTTAKTPLPK